MKVFRLVKHFLLIVMVFFVPQYLRAETSNSFTIDKSIKEIINTLMEQPIKGSIPDIIYDVDIKLDIQVMPRQKKYSIKIDLLEQIKMITGLHKELLIEEKNGVCVFTSKIDVELRRNRFPLRWLNLVKDFALDIVEKKVLEKEEELLRSIL